MTSKLVLMMYQSWADLDRALTGLTAEDANARIEGHSSFAWTVAHATAPVDSWLNVGFQGSPANSVSRERDYWTGGSGDARDWFGIRSSVDQVRADAKRFLDGKEDADLDLVIPYNGSIAFLRPIGLSLRYAIMAIASHHWVHAGEIVTIRSRTGWEEPPDSGWGQRLF